MENYIGRGKNTLICEICGNDFRAIQAGAKTCSSECRLKRNRKMTGRIASNSNIPTGTVGAITEIEICADLMRKGYAIFRAMSPACFCDVIAIKDNKIFRLECRTGYYNQNNSPAFASTIHGEIDYFAVYIPSHKECIYLDVTRKIVELN